jgi:hypothetical protein
MAVGLSFHAMALSLLFLVVGLAVAWIASKYIDKVDGTSLIALLIIPFAAYLIFSGSLESFKGGGIEWKLKAAAAAPALGATVNKKLETGDLVKQIEAGEDLDVAATFGIPTEVIIVNAPLWKTLTHPQRLRAALMVGEVVYNSLVSGSLKALVVTDEGNRPLGLFERDVFLDVLRIPFYLYPVEGDKSQAATQTTVQQMIQQTELWIILKNPAERAEYGGSKAMLPQAVGRLEALKVMAENNWNAAVVTDVKGANAGVLWRPSLAESLLIVALGGE